MVQGFFLLLIETLGIFGRFLFLPPFDHLCHLKSGVPSSPPLPPPTGCVYVNIDSAMATEFGHDHVFAKFAIFTTADSPNLLLTWPASMQIYGNKRKLLHTKRVQLP